jgi:mycothiol synthase
MGKIGGEGMKDPRPYQSESDRQAMKQLLIAGRQANNGTYYIHCGDLDLWLYYPPLEGDVWKDIYLWDDPKETSKLLGWALLSSDWIDVYVQPELRGSSPWLEMYAWAEEKAAQIAQGKDRQNVSALWIRHDDEELSDFFSTRGYRLAKGMVHLVRHLDRTIPNSAGIGGYIVRSCGGVPEVESRAMTQHKVFGSKAPFAAYLERYKSFMLSPVYDRELDIVAEVPGGQIGAFCSIWTDSVNRVGLFEPVGTHPDYQHQGLGKAVMLEGLRRLQEHGMEQAIVSTYEENSPAIRFYESLGFQLEYRLGTFEKDV